MDKQDWYDCGEKIGDIVSDAISNNDFRSLSASITNVLNESLDAMQKSMQRARAMQEEAMDAVEDARKAAAQTPGRTQGAAWRYEGSAYPQARHRSVRRRGLGISARLKEITGGILAGFNGFLTLILAAGCLLDFNFAGLIVTALFALITYGSFRMMRSGREERTITDTARNYLKVLGDREVVSVKELAAATGQNKKTVRRNLKRILQDSLISGDLYLDDEEENLIVSRKAYEQYRQSMKAYELRQKEARQAQSAAQAEKMDAKAQADRRREAEKHMDRSSEETRGIMKEGNAFITHIHEANEKIPDEVLTEKLDRLELVVTRIFEQVAAAPDSAPDMHRLMNYYLPTTTKLLDAYVELDGQHVQGQNIAKAKQEIEVSLDTINTAFEIMLDNMFRDKTWDIETDIQTLQMMMARDGLVEDGLKRKNQTAGEAQQLSFGARAAAAAEEKQTR